MNESQSEFASDPFAPEAVTEGMRESSGTEAFIIIVCASTPLLTAVRALSAFQRCKLDQVSHVENGKRYYRLRMGFFDKLSQAEAALANIRKYYQASFIESVSVPRTPNSAPVRSTAPSSGTVPAKTVPPARRVRHGRCRERGCVSP